MKMNGSLGQRNTFVTIRCTAALVLLAMAMLPGRGVGSEENDAERARLLDETPNVFEVLREQWSGSRVDDLYGQYFGLLTGDGPLQPVTLQQGIALALQNNTGLEIGRLNPVLATNEVRRALSVFDPAIFAAAGKTRSNSPLSSSSVLTASGRETFNQDVNWEAGIRKGLTTGGSLSFDWKNNRVSRPANAFILLVPEYRSTLDISLNQPLLRNFGWRYALLKVDVAQSVEEAAFFEYQAQVANLVSTVEAQYWQLVLAIENVKVEEQGLELARELLRQNQGRFDVGALPRTAVLESEAEVARREADLVRGKNLERIARDSLSNVVNARNETPEKVAQLEPTDEPTLTEYEIDARRSLESAIVGRPELIAARLDVNSKGLLEKAAQNQLLPRLDFAGSLGLNGLGGANAGPQSLGASAINADPRVDNGYSDTLNLLGDGRFYQYHFGVELEIPLNNAVAKAAYTQSKIDTKRARLSLRQLEENVTLQIKNAIDNVRSDLKSIEATGVARSLAEENVRNQKARYEVGLATTKDLIDFQERLTRARQAELQALTAYNTDLAELRRVDGTLLDYRNVQVRRADPEDTPWWAYF